METAELYIGVVVFLVAWGLWLLSLPDPTPEQVNGTTLYEGDEWTN